MKQSRCVKMVGATRCEDCICEITLGGEPQVITVRVPITIPSSICHFELAHRLVQHHNIPIYLHKELSERLQVFIQDKTEEHYRQQDQHAIENLKNGVENIDDLASAWTNKYSQFDINRQTEEMSKTVSKVGVNLTDDDVNDLAARHLEDSQLIEVQWDSTISVLKENQKREFKNFVLESFAGREVTTPVTPKDFIMKGSDSVVVVEATGPMQEESFTIHLGAQMKQMHNLRLLSEDVLQLCKYQSHDASDIPPQRIQTSMSLYSHNLNGLVLLVDDRINTYTGIKRDFGRVCSRSTELHFPDLEDQLESVRDTVPQVVQWRRDHPPPHYDCDEDALPPPLVPQHLKAGDFYITRHSNLADVHVVFHMIVDDSLRSGDINSRHPVILGLRNVLKVACLGDITTLTIPLLLTNTMSEEMTMSWCQKRAELVYKCIKGFMMEMASWGGAEMKNMQFLVPKGISEDLFQHLAAMLPNIFRVSNPLVVKSS
ncbi:FERRY endosomal RAB5 effector complex subunit 3 [Panulirus ornatus]|uniref:FERRY endosomal RAB5 effector complex subunit 3 n=1 Tax=Panulirus ornatus TaxID=150431 RepID=UPI003A85BF84